MELFFQKQVFETNLKENRLIFLDGYDTIKERTVKIRLLYGRCERHMKIFVFGEIIWDIYSDRRVIGGAPLNFAGHCNFCGHSSTILSSVGNDELGDLTESKLKELGIHGDFVQKCNKETGQCKVALDKHGVPTYQVLHDVAYDYICCPPMDKVKKENFDVLYFGTLAQRSKCSRYTLYKILNECSFREIFCDLNLRDGCYDEVSVQTCLEHATILKFSDEEAPRLDRYAFWRELSGDSMMNELFSAYPQIKVILFTKGSKGSCVYTRDGRKHEISAVSCKVASTVGAGDSFAAAWLSRYLYGDDEETSARVASKVSGYVVSVVDALPRYDISRFL